jgi:hypothetical protein
MVMFHLETYFVVRKRYKNYRALAKQDENGFA